jgi:regulator of replication initiation timing
MTIEERLKQMLGEQAFAIAALQTENDKLREQVAAHDREKSAEKPSPLRSVE